LRGEILIWVSFVKVDLFDFYLPEENIALRPCAPRENAKLLRVIPPDELQDYHVHDLPSLLQPGDALVFNDTKVIPAQLEGKRYRFVKNNGPDAAEGVANIHATLHMRESADSWRAFVKPARRLSVGEEIIFSKRADDNSDKTDELFKAEVIERSPDDGMLLRFNKSGTALDAALAVYGHMPLPPYIAARRAEDERDKRDYQTIYAREKGAVAAPTAGLHFTDSMLGALRRRGIEEHFVTLHVGAGTFLPVKADDTQNHKMHSEIGHISAETAAALNAVKARGGKIVAVGTTALRLLESAADERGQLHAWRGATDIFIAPGYHFRFVDRLMTNFHLPRSTLFMLVSAFSGLELMKKAYAYAIKSHYRFYSYGDASLLDLAASAKLPASRN